jgi:transposase
MIGPGTGVRVYLACGVTDMRKGIAGLAVLAQDVLHQKAARGAVFAFRGRRGDRIKLLYWDGQGFCLYYKVLERGRFPWPNAKDGAVRMTSAQLAMLWAPLGTFLLEIPCRAKGDRLAASGLGGSTRPRRVILRPYLCYLYGAFAWFLVVRRMSKFAETLPDDPATLKAMIAALQAENAKISATLRVHDQLVQALRLRIAKL